MTLLNAIPIETPEQIEILRKIRNATASGFTSDTSYITELRQRAWWVVMKGRLKAWLYTLPCTGNADWKPEYVVGYGLVRLADDGRWWDSLAVLPDYQRQGYGSYITADLLKRHDGPIYSLVRKDNIAAIAMHNNDQWDILDWVDSNNLLLLRSKRGD